jgi:hypothetical protein
MHKFDVDSSAAFNPQFLGRMINRVSLAQRKSCIGMYEPFIQDPPIFLRTKFIPRNPVVRPSQLKDDKMDIECRRYMDAASPMAWRVRVSSDTIEVNEYEEGSFDMDWLKLFLLEPQWKPLASL